MSFLSINGVVVGVAQGGAGAKRDTVGGGISRSADGSARLNFQAKKWHPTIKAALTTQAEALFLGAVVDGMVDHWSFDADLYSDKGNGVSDSAGATVDAADYKYGGGSLKIAASVDDFALWNCDPLDDGWTLLIWRLESSTWYQYIITGTSPSATPDVYKNGVAQTPGMPTWMNVVSSTSFGFSGHSGTAEIVDDVVLVDAFCPSTLVAGLYAFHNTQAWPLAPTLLVSGDAMPGASIKTMLGETSGWDSKQAFVDGEYFGVELSFDLQEV